MPELSLETLFISIAFILPGFLTSRLVISKLPAPEKKPKPFVEVTESLLRSTYINLVVVTFLFIVIRYWILSPNDRSDIVQSGIAMFIRNYPFELVTLLIVWLILDLLLATFFGLKWDPLEYLYTKLHNSAGTKDVDLWHILREVLAHKAETIPKDVKIWAKARLKNGNIYVGGVHYVSFPEDGQPRELLLEKVYFFPDEKSFNENQGVSPPSGAVIFNLADCDSIEFSTVTE